MKNKTISKFFAIALLSTVFYTCSDESGDDTESVQSEDQSITELDVPLTSETTIWSGTSLVFQKDAGADPTMPENQDRISDNVWITRGNDGGQIYNAVSETVADKDLSPAGTLWAIGTTANLENLSFKRFRTTLPKPKDHVNTALVMLLVEENIAIDVTFTSWSQEKLGSFTYERSTP